MYNDDGNIIGASNNDGEQDLHDSGMDLSAAGMKLKKAREMEAIRATANPQGLKQKMYDDDGNLVGASNNDGEQDLHDSGMDLSARGMKLKKAREMKSLRSLRGSIIKPQMYDDDGNIIGASNNDGEQDRHDSGMDLSASGMKLKKAREMEGLRAKGRELKEGYKKQMYDKSGQLNAWNSLNENDEISEDKSENLPSNMNLTPEGMKLKKAKEIKSLRSSRRSSMYDDDGNIIGAINNDGEQDRHNTDMDTSAEGMARKKSLELEAIRSGTVNHKETVAPRELTEDETTSLRMMLKSKLKIPDDSYQDDAADLLDYAFDMVGDGKTVGYAIEELVFMEMEVLTAEMSESFAQCLSTFLLGLSGEVTLARRSKTAIYDANGNIIEKKKDESQEADEPRIDLSTKAAAQRPTKEMQATLLSGSVSAKERSKQGIYDSNGVLTKQWNADSDDDTDEAAVHGINLSAQAAAKRASREVDSLLHKKKSGGGLGSRLSKYQEFVAPRGGYHHEGDEHDEHRMNSLDLSAKAFARKPSREVDAILSPTGGAESAKERNKQDNYDSSGVLKKQWANVEEEEITDIDAHVDAKRKLYFQQLEDEKNIRERIAKRDKMLGEQRKEQEAYSKIGGPELKLSAQSQARKPQEEVKALRAIVDPQGVKEEIYDEDGLLIKQWASIHQDDTGEGSMEESIDAQRREELQTIMMDRSLSKEERAKQIEEVKARYAAAPSENQGGGHGAHTSGNELVPVDSSLDEQRKKEFESIMRDRTLSKEERKLRIEQMKKKYSTSPVKNQSSRQAASSEKIIEEGSGLDLSALAFARKASLEVKATLLTSGTSAKERSKQGIYDSNGELTKQWASIDEAEDESKQVHPSGDDVGKKEGTPNSSFKAFISKSVDEQRREELQLLMRDRSLTKDERAQRIEEVKARYAASAAAKQGSAQTDKAPTTTLHSNCHDQSAALDDQRRRELQSIMKNRSIDRETKNRLLEEVKKKYDTIEANEDEAPPNDVDDVPINLSAASFSQKHLKELEAIKEKAAKGKSLSDRKAIYNNDTTVYYDSVSFATSQNKSKSGTHFNAINLLLTSIAHFPLTLHPKKLDKRPNAKLLNLPRSIIITMVMVA